jgi:hypothetical protein
VSLAATALPSEPLGASAANTLAAVNANAAAAMAKEAVDVVFMKISLS